MTNHVPPSASSAHASTALSEVGPGDGIERLLAARYRAARPAEPAWSDAIAQMLAHRSVRSFAPRPLAEGTLEALVAAAQSASSFFHGSKLNKLSPSVPSQALRREHDRTRHQAVFGRAMAPRTCCRGRASWPSEVATGTVACQEAAKAPRRPLGFPCASQSCFLGSGGKSNSA